MGRKNSINKLLSYFENKDFYTIKGFSSLYKEYLLFDPSKIRAYNEELDRKGESIDSQHFESKEKYFARYQEHEKHAKNFVQKASELFELSFDDNLCLGDIMDETSGKMSQHLRYKDYTKNEIDNLLREVESDLSAKEPELRQLLQSQGYKIAKKWRDRSEVLKRNECRLFDDNCYDRRELSKALIEMDSVISTQVNEMSQFNKSTHNGVLTNWQDIKVKIREGIDGYFRDRTSKEKDLPFKIEASILYVNRLKSFMVKYFRLPHEDSVDYYISKKCLKSMQNLIKPDQNEIVKKIYAKVTFPHVDLAATKFLTKYWLTFWTGFFYLILFVLDAVIWGSYVLSPILKISGIDTLAFHNLFEYLSSGRKTSSEFGLMMIFHALSFGIIWALPRFPTRLSFFYNFLKSNGENKDLTLDKVQYWLEEGKAQKQKKLLSSLLTSGVFTPRWFWVIPTFYYLFISLIPALFIHFYTKDTAAVRSCLLSGLVFWPIIHLFYYIYLDTSFVKQEIRSHIQLLFRKHLGENLTSDQQRREELTNYLRSYRPEFRTAFTQINNSIENNMMSVNSTYEKAEELRMELEACRKLHEEVREESTFFSKGLAELKTRRKEIREKIEINADKIDNIININFQEVKNAFKRK